MSLRALFIIPTDYEDLRRKGVESILEKREKECDFERVITVHPWASQTRVIDISPIHRLYEFREAYLPGCQSFKLLRYPHHVVHFIRILRHLSNLIRHERIEFIRATDPVNTGLLAWMVTRLISRPYCISIHADYDKRYQLDGSRGAPTILGLRSLGRWIEGFTLRRAQAVLPIRLTLAEKAIAQGVIPKRIHVIPHGIDLDLFLNKSPLAVRQKWGIPPHKFILSFVGRLSKENYVPDVLELVRRLRQNRADFVLVIAGDGPEHEPLKNAVEAEGLADWVRLVGYQPRGVVAALRQASNVSLCLMGGYSLIEACAAGQPVVAYNVEWHSELIKHDQTGKLLAERDIDQLVNAVNDLLDHPKEAKGLADAGRFLAIEQHDILKTNVLKCQAYHAMLSAWTSPS